MQALNCTVSWGQLGYRDTWRRGPSSILWRLLTQARSRFTAQQVRHCPWFAVFTSDMCAVSRENNEGSILQVLFDLQRVILASCAGIRGCGRDSVEEPIRVFR